MLRGPNNPSPWPEAFCFPKALSQPVTHPPTPTALDQLLRAASPTVEGEGASGIQVQTSQAPPCPCSEKPQVLPEFWADSQRPCFLVVGFGLCSFFYVCCLCSALCPFLSFFFSFWSCPCGMRKFPIQGSKMHHKLLP